MIKAKFYLGKDQKITRFKLTGHADYSSGPDIVCAAVSALAINTVNSLDRFTKTPHVVSNSDTGGYLVVDQLGADPQSQLLLLSLQNGLMDIAARDNNQYIEVKIFNN
ncbi:ribosomal-processing cysteine protease Prp [Lactobacillus sp. 3B(2020)]|uniref:ribosomal-processing cysteine protease Prp n=1 Tax=Lactobacillus sp. 3B(2020) TaxID=2695882 RepID=UPI0015DD5258|nr:ribosomal-processing cysteine protease Prp [Lactobacillus sp. 3B(2020)]QLL70280.1 ribosomal-processing cysteine protease Prp [Lactobacillus sp. 3B(2020)]